MKPVGTRLEALEKRRAGLEGREFVQCGLLLDAPEGVRLIVDLWDGKPGSGGPRIESIHKTEAEALEQYESLVEKYGASNKFTPAFINCLLGDVRHEQHEETP